MASLGCIQLYFYQDLLDNSHLRKCLLLKTGKISTDFTQNFNSAGLSFSIIGSLDGLKFDSVYMALPELGFGRSYNKYFKKQKMY